MGPSCTPSLGSWPISPTRSSTSASTNHTWPTMWWRRIDYSLWYHTTLRFRLSIYLFITPNIPWSTSPCLISDPQIDQIRTYLSSSHSRIGLQCNYVTEWNPMSSKRRASWPMGSTRRYHSSSPPHSMGCWCALSSRHSSWTPPTVVIRLEVPKYRYCSWRNRTE